MYDFTLLFIIACVATQIIFWIVTAFSNKKTTENKGGWTMRIIAIVVVGSVVFLRTQLTDLIPILSLTFWDYSIVSGVIADVVVLAGVIVMIWSRIALGKNWSANVTFKEDHELITKGPYAFSRHPIYSGLILIILGLVIYIGSLIWLLLFVLFFIGAYYKAYKEEKLLLAHFPEEYPLYKKSVKSLIPFIF